MPSAIVERIVNGEKWWVDSESGRTYGLCRVVPEDSARAKHARHQARAAKSPAIQEKHIEQTCSEWLELDGWRTLKTDPVSRKEWGKGFGELGMADRLYIRYEKQTSPPSMDTGTSQVIWIEWKSRDGKLKLHQQDWHVAERCRGAVTLIAGKTFPASIEGFQNWYRQSGLMRRKI
jgi:hypothetical protein